MTSQPSPTAPPPKPEHPLELKVIVGGATQRSPWRQRLLRFGCVACLAAVLVLLLELVRLPAQPPAPAAVRAGLGSVAELVQPVLPTAIAQTPTQFGHLSYLEARRQRLMVVGSYSQDSEQRFERLDREAGLALLKLIDAARAEGVWIVPVSGFRDLDRQETLFRSQAEQVGSEAIAARAVAPPGYSEHHTGLAVDLADGLAPSLDVSTAFGKSAAFQWLTRNARTYGYELSFPRDNPQGINYEPWHWRYVGSIDAQRVFAVAQTKFRSPTPQG